MTGSFNMYETCLGPPMGWGGGGVTAPSRWILKTGRFQYRVYQDFVKLAVSDR